MTILNPRTFKALATRNILHHKSERLKAVFAALDIYNKKQETLDNLKKKVIEWKIRDPHEFRDRHGHDLLFEIERELAKSPSGELINGDILFRLVPGESEQRGRLQNIISLAQGVESLKTKYVSYTITGKETSSSIDESWNIVQHVGIYVNQGVYEIGAKGLEFNRMVKRENYDVIVRLSSDFAHKVTEITIKAREDLRQGWSLIKTGRLSGISTRLGIFSGATGYPLYDLAKLAFAPHSGGCYDGGTRGKLIADNKKHIRDGTQYRMKQRVVCSHFVHAVMYAAIETDGTLRTATDHKYDSIFKISPSHLWRQFRNKKGLWEHANAECIGIQHKGKKISSDRPSPLSGVCS